MIPDDTGLLLRLQTEVLEAVACGEPLVAVADLLCRRAEALAPDAVCSILTVDADGLLHPLAAPSLPLATATTREGVLLKFEVVMAELFVQDFPVIYGLLHTAVRDLKALW